MKTLRFLSIAAICCPIYCAFSQVQPVGAKWIYQLIEGSQITDDCPVCDRLPIVQPLRGSFSLTLVESGPFRTTYEFRDIIFTNQVVLGPQYNFTGTGVYQISGEVAVRQELALYLTLDNGFTRVPVVCTNAWIGGNLLTPMFRASVNQSNGTITQQITLVLNSAPFREMWFSTIQDFKAGIWNSPTNVVSGGDLISTSGRIVKANHQLTSLLGIMPPAPDLGLRDVALLSGGEIAFSLEQDAFSENLGRTIHHGDIVSSRGAILRTNAELVAAFAPDSIPATGAGLNALFMSPTRHFLFSVETGFTSQALNTSVTPGDLLSETGGIVRSSSQLLSSFGPLGLTNAPRLKAVHVWRSGEAWFTLGSGMDTTTGAHFDAGDLLSSAGYLVYRSSELLSLFAPQPASNGVDALYIISDSETEAALPVLETPLWTNQPLGSLVLNWSGAGKVFQVESTPDLRTTFSAVSPLMPDTSYVDLNAGTNGSGFYRVRQW